MVTVSGPEVRSSCCMLILCSSQGSTVMTTARARPQDARINAVGMYRLPASSNKCACACALKTATSERVASHAIMVRRTSTRLEPRLILTRHRRCNHVSRSRERGSTARTRRRLYGSTSRERHRAADDTLAGRGLKSLGRAQVQLDKIYLGARGMNTRGVYAMSLHDHAAV